MNNSPSYYRVYASNGSELRAGNEMKGKHRSSTS